VTQIAEEFDDPEPFSIEDEKFDLIYPPNVRKLSSVFWTPVAVAAEAAKMLVTDQTCHGEGLAKAGTRVLDIGCGPGKFCLVGASLTNGRFTGVEQRSDLVAAARQAATDLGLPRPPARDSIRSSLGEGGSNVEFIDGNVLEVDFANYDAFYLFNPFEENMYGGHKIDSAVPLSPTLFKRYTSHVAAQLGARPLGTRVVTYAGYADDIPACYYCEEALFGDDLKLWIKQREHEPDIERLGLNVSRSYRGAIGWASPRRHVLPHVEDIGCC
jgi:SAM-dependent methyltransferase